ncbi:MAG: DNA alkylation repair protein, partial [Bacteroidetes bacterium]|nr:DNA alkylation repair protein [Bacteroidota bacterium]
METLRSLGSPAAVKGMERFGIQAADAYGVPAPAIRSLSKKIGIDHRLALSLWETGNHDARILAAIIADPERITVTEMDRWVRSMENWAQCDTCCLEVFRRSRTALSLPQRWSPSPKEFVRRAGIVMIAALAVHRKDLSDDEIWSYTPLLLECADDDRNFVKKSVNWALRQIGKRNERLRQRAVGLAAEIQARPSRSARWIAA